MKTLVIAELLEGESRKTTLSAITGAKQIGGDFDIIAIGDSAADAVGALTGFGAGTVHIADVDGHYVAEAYAPTIAAVAESGDYNVVVVTASSFGKDVLPYVAAHLNAGIAPDVTAIADDGGTLQYTRPMYAGNVNGTLHLTTDVQCVSVRQSAFEPAIESGGSSSTASVDVEDNPVEDKLEVLGVEVVKSERPDLAEADIVVSGGRALKSAENFEKVLEPLVDALGAAMGASRAACDAGYVPNELQVGQTGKMVAPKLYFAVGISGAIQHLAGMKGSKTIVAINTNKEEPIAQVADYFWVTDLFEAVPALTEAVKKVL